MPTLLERGIPIDIINDYSSVEKGPGRPPHWEMVFWWTRKPLAGARAIIAASLLQDNAYQNMEQFLNDLFPCRGEKKTVHSCNPSQRLIEKLRGKRLLDPFAGFGSIPLEASRLGVDAVAVEFCSKEASRYRRQGYDGVNLFVAVLGCALSQFTQYKRIIGVKSLGELVEKYIYPTTAAAIAKSLTGAEGLFRLVVRRTRPIRA
jgi:adenine-specific DNA methylase